MIERYPKCHGGCADESEAQRILSARPSRGLSLLYSLLHPESAYLRNTRTC